MFVEYFLICLHSTHNVSFISVDIIKALTKCVC